MREPSIYGMHRHTDTLYIYLHQQQQQSCVGSVTRLHNSFFVDSTGANQITESAILRWRLHPCAALTTYIYLTTQSSTDVGKFARIFHLNICVCIVYSVCSMHTVAMQLYARKMHFTKLMLLGSSVCSVHRKPPVWLVVLSLVHNSGCCCCTFYYRYRENIKKKLYQTNQPASQVQNYIIIPHFWACEPCTTTAAAPVHRIFSRSCTRLLYMVDVHYFQFYCCYFIKIMFIKDVAQ